jgi:hypothetical protein
MRFVLRQGTREVLVFSRNRFAQFDDDRHARAFLVERLRHSENLARLRRAVADNSAFAYLAHADPLTLIAKVSVLLARGDLALLLDPDALAPWSWPFGLTPSFGTAESGAEAEAEALVADETTTEEQESEVEEPKPEPVIPPVYPAVAKSEADKIEFETKVFSIALDLLRWVGAAAEEVSDLAEEMVSHALASAGSVADAVGAAMASLLGLNGSPGVFGESEVGSNARSVSGIMGAIVQAVTQALFGTMGGLAGASDFGPSPTQIGTAIKALAPDQSDALHRTVDNSSEALKELLGKGEKGKYDFGGDSAEEAIPEIDEDGFDESALLDDAVWLDEEYQGLADSPENVIEESYLGPEVVARVRAKDLPVGTFVTMRISDALGRTLKENKMVGGTGGPGGLSTLRWRPGMDVVAPAGGDVLQVFFTAEAEGDAGVIQSGALDVQLNHAVAADGSALSVPIWLHHPDDAASGVDASLPIARARVDHTVRLRAVTKGFEEGDSLRLVVFSVLSPTELEEVATINTTVEDADLGYVEAELPLANVEGISLRRPWANLVFRAICDAKDIAVTSPPLRTTAAYFFTDNVNEAIDLSPGPWLRNAQWVTEEGTEVRTYLPGVPGQVLRMAVQGLRLDADTALSFELYGAEHDDLVTTLPAKLEDGVAVVAWTLDDVDYGAAGLYFTVDALDTNGPIRSPVLKARPRFMLSDNGAGEVDTDQPPRLEQARWVDDDGKTRTVFPAHSAPQTLKMAIRAFFMDEGATVSLDVLRASDDTLVGNVSAQVQGNRMLAEFELDEPALPGMALYFQAYAQVDGFEDAPVSGQIVATPAFAFSDNPFEGPVPIIGPPVVDPDPKIDPEPDPDPEPEKPFSFSDGGEQA